MNFKNNPVRLLFKFSAFFLSLNLALFESVSLAATADTNYLSGDNLRKPRAIEIPQELGTIEESYQGNSGKTIVFIQDAHEALDAQENIASMIDYLVREHKVRTVFEEGYEGPVPSDEYFGDFEDDRIKEKVSYFLMDRLRLGGAEYAHINRKTDFDLIGVDDIKLHSENVAWYAESVSRKPETDRDLLVLETEIRKLADRFLPSELKTWLRLKERLDTDKLNQLDYLKRMKQLWLASISIQEFRQTYPHIELVLSVETDPTEEAVKKVKEMDYRLLFQEIEHLENYYAGIHLRSRIGKQVFQFRKNIQLINRLHNIEVTPPEYEAVKHTLKGFRTGELADFIAENTNKSIVLSRQWERNIKAAVKFYEIARARDRAMEKHLDRFLNNPYENVAVLVFGGFHAPEIKRILRQRQLSYKVVTPKITEIKARHRAYYKQLMGVGYHDFEIPVLVAKASKTLSYPYSLTRLGRVSQNRVRGHFAALRRAVFEDEVILNELRDPVHERFEEVTMAFTGGGLQAAIREELRTEPFVSLGPEKETSLPGRQELRTDAPHVSTVIEDFGIDEVTGFYLMQSGVADNSEPIPVIQTSAGDIAVKKLKVQRILDARFVLEYANRLQKAGLPILIIPKKNTTGSKPDDYFTSWRSPGKSQPNYYHIERLAGGRDISRRDAEEVNIRAVGRVLGKAHAETRDLKYQFKRSPDHYSFDRSLVSLTAESASWLNRLKSLDPETGAYLDRVVAEITKEITPEKLKALPRHAILSDLNFGNMKFNQAGDEVTDIYDLDHVRDNAYRIEDFFPVLVHSGRTLEGFYAGPIRRAAEVLIQAYDETSEVPLTEQEHEILPMLFIAQMTLHVMSGSRKLTGNPADNAARLERLRGRVQIIRDIAREFGLSALDDGRNELRIAIADPSAPDPEVLVPAAIRARKASFEPNAVKKRTRLVDKGFDRENLQSYGIDWKPDFFPSEPERWHDRLLSFADEYEISQEAQDMAIEAGVKAVLGIGLPGGVVRALFRKGIAKLRKRFFRSPSTLDPESPAARKAQASINRAISDAGSRGERRRVLKGYQRKRGYLWTDYAINKFSELPEGEDFFSTVTKVMPREWLVDVTASYFSEVMGWKGGLITDAKDREILNFLIAKLRDDDPWVVDAAVRGIGRLANHINEASMQIILEEYYYLLSCRQCDELSRGAVARGLQQIRKNSKKPVTVSLQKLIVALRNEDSTWVQTYIAQAIEVLLEKYDAETVQAHHSAELVPLLVKKASGTRRSRRSHIMLRVASIKALAQLGWYDPEVIDTLSDLLITDRDSTVQEAAMWALARLHVTSQEGINDIDLLLNDLILYIRGRHEGRHNIFLANYAKYLLKNLYPYSSTKRVSLRARSVLRRINKMSVFEKLMFFFLKLLINRLPRPVVAVDRWYDNTVSLVRGRAQHRRKPIQAAYRILSRKSAGVYVEFDDTVENPVVLLDIESLIPREGEEQDYRGADADAVFDLVKHFLDQGWSVVISDRFRVGRDKVRVGSLSGEHMRLRTDFLDDTLQTLAANLPVRIPARHYERGKKAKRMNGVLVPQAGKPVIVFGRGEEIFEIDMTYSGKTASMISAADYPEAQVGDFDRITRKIALTQYKAGDRIPLTEDTPALLQDLEIDQVYFEGDADLALPLEGAGTERLSELALLAREDNEVPQNFQLRLHPETASAFLESANPETAAADTAAREELRSGLFEPPGLLGYQPVNMDTFLEPKGILIQQFRTIAGAGFGMARIDYTDADGIIHLTSLRTGREFTRDKLSLVGANYHPPQHEPVSRAYVSEAIQRRLDPFQHQEPAAMRAELRTENLVILGPEKTPLPGRQELRTQKAESRVPVREKNEKAEAQIADQPLRTGAAGNVKKGLAANRMSESSEKLNARAIARILQNIKQPTVAYIDYKDLTRHFSSQQAAEVFALAYRYPEKVRLLIYNVEDALHARLIPFRQLRTDKKNVWITSASAETAYENTGMTFARGIKSFLHLSRANEKARQAFGDSAVPNVRFFRYANGDEEHGLLAAALLWQQYRLAGRRLPGVEEDDEGFFVIDETLRAVIQGFESSLAVAIAA